MKNLLICLLFLTSLAVFADENPDCPIEITSLDVCAQLTWTKGPFLIEGRPTPGRRYSELDLIFWEKNDLQKSPILIGPLRVYPWMIMNGGHEHGGRPVEMVVSPKNVYHVSKILFQKMPGHWEIRLAIVTDPDNFDPKVDYMATKIIEFEHQ